VVVAGAKVLPASPPPILGSRLPGFLLRGPQLSAIPARQARNGHPAPTRHPMRSTLSLLVLLSVGSSDQLYAQLPPHEAASRARALFRAAGGALERGDSAAAFSAIDSAARTWPSQAAYPRAAARFAARLGRTAEALTYLHLLTSLGVSWDLTDPALARIAGDPAVRAAAEENRTATAPLERSRVLWSIGPDSLLVEGVAVDSVTGRYFVSSIREGKVLVREGEGRTRDFIRRGTGGLGTVLGMAIDHRRGLLWATSADADSVTDFAHFNGRSALFAFDLRTGDFRAKVELPPAPEGRQLGDVIVTPRGTIFASDSRAPAVYRIPAGSLPAVAEVAIANDPLMRNLQGMVVNADETRMYLADYTHGLFLVDLVGRSVRSLRPPHGATLLGIDGMADGGEGRLIVVQNGLAPVRVARIHLDRDGTAVTRIEVIDRPPLAPGEATLGVRVGRSFVYVGTVPAVLRSLDLPTR
jgi:hypothetical protein